MLIKVIAHEVWHVWGYTRLRLNSSSKENVANLVLVSMWTSVTAEEKRHKQFEATKYRNTLI